MPAHMMSARTRHVCRRQTRSQFWREYHATCAQNRSRRISGHWSIRPGLARSEQTAPDCAELYRDIQVLGSLFRRTRGGIFLRPAPLLRANHRSGMVNIAHVGHKTRQPLIFFRVCLVDGWRGWCPARRVPTNWLPSPPAPRATSEAVVVARRHCRSGRSGACERSRWSADE